MFSLFAPSSALPWLESHIFDSRQLEKREEGRVGGGGGQEGREGEDTTTLHSGMLQLISSFHFREEMAS